MTTWTIKADKDLFDAWQELAGQVRMLSSIVQNDLELSREELFEWVKSGENLQSSLDALLNRTDCYIGEGSRQSRLTLSRIRQRE